MTLHEWCRNNWNALPEDVRKRCVDHLATFILTGVNRDANLEYLMSYRDNASFHLFGGGMMVRNCLRQVLPDTQLPAVHVDHEGKPYAVDATSGNWDDYYTGAIDELLERYP